MDKDLHFELSNIVISNMMGNLDIPFENSRQDILKIIHQFENLLANPVTFFRTITNAEQMLFARNLTVFQIADISIRYTFDWCHVKFEPSSAGKQLIAKLFTERQIKPRCSPTNEMMLPIDMILNIEQEEEDEDGA